MFVHERVDWHSSIIWALVLNNKPRERACVCRWMLMGTSHIHYTHWLSSLGMHMNTQPHLPCTVLWWACIICRSAYIHTHCECTYGSSGCVFGTCVFQTSTLCALLLSLSLSLGMLCTYVHVYLFASARTEYVPKTWFLIRRHEARMHQSAVSRRAVNLEQSSLLIRWLINAHGARERQAR
jgi:hypothetical protein